MEDIETRRKRDEDVDGKMKDIEDMMKRQEDLEAKMTKDLGKMKDIENMMKRQEDLEANKDMANLRRQVASMKRLDQDIKELEQSFTLDDDDQLVEAESDSKRDEDIIKEGEQDIKRLERRKQYDLKRMGGMRQLEEYLEAMNALQNRIDRQGRILPTAPSDNDGEPEAVE